MRTGTVRRFKLITGESLEQLIERADQWIDETGVSVVSYTTQANGLHPALLLFYEESRQGAGNGKQGE